MQTTLDEKAEKTRYKTQITNDWKKTKTPKNEKCAANLN